VLLFTLAVAVLTSLLSGTAPALAARETVVGSLKEGAAQSTIGRGRHRMRSLLIVAQVAVSFLLLIGAGLMLRSFAKLQHVDPGFQPEKRFDHANRSGASSSNASKKRAACRSYCPR